MIYFWADTHFNHSMIIEHCHRPYGSLESMHADLIGAWNDTVKDTDTIYFLGDFAFKTKDGADVAALFTSLRGHKHLIIGNHDERNPAVLKLPWESVAHLRTVKADGMRAEVCHYPLETWKAASKGAIMLHGHSHGTLRHVIPHRFDVGVDVYRTGPISFAHLWVKAATQAFAPVDHHE